MLWYHIVSVAENDNGANCYDNLMMLVPPKPTEAPTETPAPTVAGTVAPTAAPTFAPTSLFGDWECQNNITLSLFCAGRLRLI